MLEFIKSKDYRKFIEDNEIVISDWDMATIIINNREEPYNYRRYKLKDIIEKTEDEELKIQILNYIETKDKAIERYRSEESNVYYELSVKNNEVYEIEDIFSFYHNAFIIGLREEKPFRIEKRKFLDCVENDFDSYMEDMWYSSEGNLIEPHGTREPSDFKPKRTNVGYRYVTLPYIFKFGDIVRIAGTDIIGIVGSLKDKKEEADYIDRMKKCGDYSDFQVYVNIIFDGSKVCSSFHHEHVSPLELEYADLEISDIRKGYVEYIAQQMKTKSLWSGEIRNPKRIPFIIKQLEELWEKVPDMRLGQLILNCGGDNLFNIEDERLVENIQKFFKKF